MLGDLSAETDRKIVNFSEWTTMLDLVEHRYQHRRFGDDFPPAGLHEGKSCLTR